MTISQVQKQFIIRRAAAAMVVRHLKGLDKMLGNGYNNSLIKQGDWMQAIQTLKEMGEDYAD